MNQQMLRREQKVGGFMSSPVISVGPETSLVDAVEMMILRGVGNLVVLDAEKVLGIITEREFLQHLTLNKTVPNKKIKYLLTHAFTKVTPETSILDAAKAMIAKKARLLVFQKDNLGSDHLVGIITSSDLVRAFVRTDRNPSIESAMTNKIHSVKPDNTVLHAAKLMFKKGIGSVIVSSNGSQYGIFTERDLLNRVIASRADIEDKVGPYMTIRLITSKLGIGAKDAAKLMIANKIKRLPLVREGRIVAMVTARDLIEAYQRGR